MDDHISLSDEELVQLALKKREDFELIFNRYQHKLLRYIQRQTKLSPEDILQEVFITVYQQLPAYRSGSNFSTWIYKITKNKIIDSYRRRVARICPVDLSESTLESFASLEDIPKKTDQLLLNEYIQHILNDIDPLQREVLKAFFFGHYSYEEISKTLGIPTGTVGTHISRGKEKIKKRLRAPK
jgi:RNA polymerase sigma-70 factor (ECF subfamily)